MVIQAIIDKLSSPVSHLDKWNSLPEHELELSKFPFVERFCNCLFNMIIGSGKGWNILSLMSEMPSAMQHASPKTPHSG